jgi:hypothetical protein
MAPFAGPGFLGNGRSGCYRLRIRAWRRDKQKGKDHGPPLGTVTSHGAIPSNQANPIHPDETSNSVASHSIRLIRKTLGPRYLAEGGRRVDIERRHVVLPLHVCHAVEELVELLLRKHRAESSDSARDLAARCGYSFGCSLVVHRLVGGPEIFPPAARIFPARFDGVDENFVWGKVVGDFTDSLTASSESRARESRLSFSTDASVCTRGIGSDPAPRWAASRTSARPSQSRYKPVCPSLGT